MDKAKKKHLKRYITWGALALVVVALAIMPLLAKTEAASDGPSASILSAVVQTGDVSFALHGGGTLDANDVEEVTLPSGVKITEFLVKNGDFVTEGTPVAAVDKVSVMTAITEVTDTLDYLREELEDARDEKISSTVTATAGGRVKVLFAQAGDSVQDVMLRDGALAILSLDGLMAVKLQRSLDISTGENVLVTLADGTEVDGRVESNLDNVVVITVEDDSYEVGQTVSVSTEDGQRLGQGTLYIHNAWKATAYSGTIESVNTKLERTVSSGATLFTLTDRDFEGELQRRANQHREYEELLQKLFQMYESGVLTAPCDGEVSGVDSDSVHLLSSVPESWELVPLTASAAAGEEKTWTVMLLSAETSTKTCTGTAECPLTWEEHSEENQKTCQALCRDCKINIFLSQHDPSCITWCTKAETADKCTAQKHYSDCIYSCDHGKTESECDATGAHYLTCIKACTSSASAAVDCPATGTHKTDCLEACTHADMVEGCPATKTHYSDCIKGCIESSSKDKVCPSSKHKSNCYFYGMTYTATAVKLYDVGNELLVYTDLSNKVYTVQQSGSGWVIVGEQLNTDTLIGKPIPISVSNPSSFEDLRGSTLLLVTGTRGTETVDIGPVLYQKVSSDTGTGTGSVGKDALESLLGGRGSMSISGMTGGLSGYGSYSSGITAETEDLFALEESTLLSVTPHDTATLIISLDEHDISKVYLGQKATVKVEALKDQEFEAEITSISGSGTNNGGSSKFSVELTFSMSEDMISGMSATAVIPLETRQDVTIIPLAALVEDGAKTLVYTAVDKDGSLASPVEVVTGIADGDNVEVISGLELGQMIYYSFYDTLELDTSAEANKYSFG